MITYESGFPLRFNIWDVGEDLRFHNRWLGFVHVYKRNFVCQISPLTSFGRNDTGAGIFDLLLIPE